MTMHSRPAVTHLPPLRSPFPLTRHLPRLRPHIATGRRHRYPALRRSARSTLSRPARLPHRSGFDPQPASPGRTTRRHRFRRTGHPGRHPDAGQGPSLPGRFPGGRDQCGWRLHESRISGRRSGRLSSSFRSPACRRAERPGRSMCRPTSRRSPLLTTLLTTVTTSLPAGNWNPAASPSLPPHRAMALHARGIRAWRRCRGWLAPGGRNGLARVRSASVPPPR